MSQAELHWMWRETMNKISSYSRRVSEGRDVLAASEFARWLEFSGFIKLFEANPQAEPLKVDGPLMRWTVGELLEQCNERFRTNSDEPKFRAEAFQSLHEKIDMMAGYLAQLSVAPAVAVHHLPVQPTAFEKISSGRNGHQVPVSRCGASENHGEQTAVCIPL